MNSYLDYDFINHKEIPSNLKWGNEENSRVDVSILMPIFNHDEYLPLAIRSCLNQSFSGSYEIVIVDNNHPDIQKNNQKIVESFSSRRIRYFVNESNVGPIENWNRCLILAKGEYLTFCHDDDELLPHTLEKLLLCMKSMTNKKSLIIGNYNIINGCNSVIKKCGVLFENKYRRFTAFDLFMGNVTNGCGSLYHRESIIGLGGFKQEYYPSIDYALNSSYLLNFGAVILSEPTFNYRITDINDSRIVYKEIAKADKTIRDLLIKRISGWRPFYNIIADSIYIKSMYVNTKKWGREKGLGLKRMISYYTVSVFISLINIIRIFKHLTSYKSFV